MLDSSIDPEWINPPGIGTFSTTRFGGVSPAPWDSLNLGINTRDSIENVCSNRMVLSKSLPEGVNIQWLKQIHGADIFEIENSIDPTPPQADICYTKQSNLACAVLTADCLPVLICNSTGTEIAAAHAGWRGLVAGVLNQAIIKFDSPPGELQVWIGPGIGRTAFEVGREVIDAVLAARIISVKSLDSLVEMHPSDPDKRYLDLSGVARANLFELGVRDIFGGALCTHSNSKQFFSYRRDGETGRMASLIWINR